jgi:hypothetical protein
MIDPHIEDELRRQLARFPTAQQRRMLDFARTLATTPSRGARGSSLQAFAGTIPAEDLAQMQKAIEADCEQIDVRGL